MTVAKKYFVFIEILDHEINNLLCALRTIFSDDIPVTGVHLTIQGPLTDEPTMGELQTIGNRLKNAIQKDDDYFLFNGVRHFEHAKNHYIALGVQCKSLKRVWKKPDFSDEFNPHITLYSGEDSKRAEAIEDFLKREAITLHCKDFIVTSYTSQTPQRALFSTFKLNSSQTLFPKLIHLGRIKPDILARASEMVWPYKLKYLGKDAKDLLLLADQGRP